MDRFLQQCGVSFDHLTPLDRLAFIADRGMGALSYSPLHEMVPHEESQEPIDLDQAALTVRSLYAGSPIHVNPCLAKIGTPAVGGQPKLLIGYDGNQAVEGTGLLSRGYSHWIVKFCATDNTTSERVGNIEYVFALLAKKAGIHMTGVRLFLGEGGNSYFLTRRFDRTSRGRRVYVQSASSLLNVDSRNSNLEYSDLFKLSDFLTNNYSQKLFLFRQMLFNILAGNRDDHLRNFAFMLNKAGEWTCTPAFDISWNPGVGRNRALAVNGLRHNISRNDVLNVAKRSSITKRDALDTLEQVSFALANCESLLREHDVSDDVSRTIARTIERHRREFRASSRFSVSPDFTWMTRDVTHQLLAVQAQISSADTPCTLWHRS